VGRAHVTCEEVRSVYRIVVRHVGGERLLCILRKVGR
jgi:hypothetical protein